MAGGLFLLRNKENAYYLALFVISLFTLLAIEISYPFFFLNDDNRTQFLPFFAYNYKSLLNLQVPFYNFHQFLGYPLYSNGQAATFYPLVYLSGFLSNLIFNHSFAIIDILVSVHLLIGAYGFYFLGRYINLSPPASLWGALTWVFNSFFIYVSNSWWMVSGVTAYLPWLIYTALQLITHRKLSLLILNSLLRTLLFFIGHAQFFVYICIFEFITVLCIVILNKRTDLREKTIFYGLSWLITVISSLPFLVPYWYGAQNSFRETRITYQIFSSESFDILKWSFGLIYPFAGHFLDLETFWRNLHNLSHIGYINLFLAMIALYLLFTKKESKNKAMLIVFWAAFLFSLLWASGALDPIIYNIPILNRFRWHFKLVAFVNFYLSLLSAFGLMFLLNHNEKLKKRLFPALLIIQTLNMICLYTVSPIRSFNTLPHKEKIPLYEPLKEELSSSRIITLGADFSDLKSSGGVGYNYAALFNLYHISGYDILAPKSNYEASTRIEPLRFFNLTPSLQQYYRTWGVRWYIFLKYPPSFPVESLNYRQLQLLPIYKTLRENISSANYFSKRELGKAFTDSKRIIFEDKRAKPLVYQKNSESSVEIKYEIGVNSISMETSSLDESIIVINFLYNPDFRAILDGESVLNIAETSIKQMEIRLPKGKHTLEIKYVPRHFYTGVYTSLCAFSILILLSFLLRKAQPRD